MPDRLSFTAAAPFESARQLTSFPEGHRARRLHGHSFLAKVEAAMPEDSSSFPGARLHELRTALTRCIAPLDYSSLNDHLEHPSDENLARWLRDRLDVPGVREAGIQSTRDQGADVDRSEHVQLWRRYRFEAAHRLPNVPDGHKCGRMHGHGFEVILHAGIGPSRRDGGFDADRLEAYWAPIHAELHQACLNDISGLENPTSELIGRYIWQRLRPALPELTWVTVYETATCGAHFDGRRYRIWKEMSLDSAVRLQRAPAGDPRRGVHGHTYALRLHLEAPLDQVLGWIIDFGDVKEIFRPIYLELDHRPLYELAGVEDSDAASLAHWIKAQASPRLPQLDRIDLYETRGCGVVLSWGTGAPAVPV